MNYTLNQLQIFVKIVENQSITRASEELHLTQPAVSIQLRNFQDQFDIPLTEVVGRKIYITDFGYEIAKSATEILLQVKEIDYKTLAYKGHLTGKIKLSIVSTAKYVMPYFLTDFMALADGVELTMDVTNKSSVIQSLEKNEVDFALVSILPSNMNIEQLDLLQNKLFLVGGAQYKSKSKKIANVSVLKDLPLIFREQGSGTRQTMESFMKMNQLPIVKKMELTSNEAVKQSIKAGLGYSIMPLIGIKSELQSGELQIIPVKGLPIVTSWSLIWLKGKRHSPAAAAFLDYVKNNKEDIIKSKFQWYERY